MKENKVDEVFKTESAGYLMNHIARQFAILLGKGLKPLGIAPAQFPILLELWQKDGLSQQELVERADLKQATIANTLARMERDGLITREPNPDDPAQPPDYADGASSRLAAAVHGNCPSHQPNGFVGFVGKRTKVVFGNGGKNCGATARDDYGREVRGPMAQLGILKCRLLLRSSESSLRFENKVQAA